MIPSIMSLHITEQLYSGTMTQDEDDALLQSLEQEINTDYSTAEEARPNYTVSMHVQHVAIINTVVSAPSQCDMSTGGNATCWLCDIM